MIAEHAAIRITSHMLELALAGQHRRGDQCGLARRGNAHRLQPDDRRQEVAETVRNADDRGQREHRNRLGAGSGVLEHRQQRETGGKRSPA